MQQAADLPTGSAPDQAAGLWSDRTERRVTLAAMVAVVGAAYAVAYVIDLGSPQPWGIGDQIAWWGAAAAWLALLAGLAWKLGPDDLG
jgi:hypothetical protein